MNEIKDIKGGPKGGSPSKGWLTLMLRGKPSAGWRMAYLAFVLFTVVALSYTTHAQTISLAGNWNFQMDRNDAGIREQWFNKKLSDNIKLPGSMLTNGKGDEVTVHTKW